MEINAETRKLRERLEDENNVDDLSIYRDSKKVANRLHKAVLILFEDRGLAIAYSRRLMD